MRSTQESTSLPRLQHQQRPSPRRLSTSDWSTAARREEPFPLSFTNTGTATLHYRASIDLGGTFSLQGAAADGSLTGDLVPSSSAHLTVVAGIIPTTSAAGAVLTGALTITTNAAGADNKQIAIAMTAQGSTCTLTCGAFAKCTPSNASPYCANTATDNINCGACGHACGTGEVCSNGSCALTCGALTKCSPSAGSDYCANTMTDTNNCGACGNACGTGQVCSSGVCTLSCGALSKCSPSTGSPYCANTTTDNANCGSCGNACTGANVCSNGVCTITCGALTTCSPSTGAPYCANTLTDNANCGACGNGLHRRRRLHQRRLHDHLRLALDLHAVERRPLLRQPHDRQRQLRLLRPRCGPGQVCNNGGCTLTCGALSMCTPSSGPAYCANFATDPPTAAPAATPAARANPA